MKIKTLTLTNFRGVIALSLTLNEQLNVFYGINGCGKSTVLDALAIMLSWTVSKIHSSDTSGQPIAEEDITNGKATAAIDLTCQVMDNPINWKLSKTRQGHLATEDNKNNVSDLTNYATSLQGEITQSNEQTNIPLFVYYPVNRAVLDIPLRITKKHNFSLLTAYRNALKSGADFRAFFEWFREREDLENENRKYQNELFPDKQLNTVREALSKFLPDFSDLAVRRNPLRMEVIKTGQRLLVNQLSDGEKCMIALIGDLARRLAIANPILDNPLYGNSVVLIDEIDLHLHPKWQKMIVPNLLQVFPHCQFIISTHSPHVITHVQPECLFLLKQNPEGITAEKPNESYGKNVDRILEDLMGLDTTRPDSIAAELRSVFKLISTGDINTAKNQIETLQEKIGHDPELVKATVLIRRMEILGK